MARLLPALSFAAVLSAAALADPPNAPPPVQVPFGCGYAFPVSQTHNIGSHQHNDAYAWDFRMPVGTPVVAARDGVVRMARGDSSQGGCDPRFAADANYVVVDHGDGYETQYLHFSQVVVQPGQRVHTGQLLGYSGETGWACGAHLHFKVARYIGDGWNNPSVPDTILGYGDPALESVVRAPACDRSHPFLASRTPASAPADELKQVLASAEPNLASPGRAQARAPAPASRLLVKAARAAVAAAPVSAARVAGASLR